ncbi:MAG: ABC-2 type transport system ATP-binding protein [Glaciecola sp.]|jgi:ABC-2 type transport system ATP-binding protein
MTRSIPAPAPVVTCTDVHKRWGSVHALDGISLQIPPGVTGLLGANGAGKTTLIGMILGLHPPDSGRIEVLGRDPSTFGPDVRARLGYAPENDVLPPETQAQELVRHVGELHGLPRRAAITRATEVLTLLGLGEERLRPIGTMSLGQKQRTKIAQSIVHDPDLVLLDEPTNGLDPIQRDDMLTTIRRIGTELGLHVILSSHLIGEVERVCDNVVVLDEGRLTASGEVSGMVTDSGGHYDLEVVGDVPALVAALRDVGIDAVAGPRIGTIVLKAESDEDLDKVRDAIAAAGVGLRALVRQHRSLEEQFFS